MALLYRFPAGFVKGKMAGPAVSGRLVGDFEVFASFSGFFRFRQDRIGSLRVGGVELVFDLPLVHELADTLFFQLVFELCPALGPSQQALKVDLIHSADDNIEQFAGSDGSPDRLFIDAEQVGGLGDGNSDRSFFWHKVVFGD